jgi:hypothetical protein
MAVIIITIVFAHFVTDSKQYQKGELVKSESGRSADAERSQTQFRTNLKIYRYAALAITMASYSRSDSRGSSTHMV